MSKPHTTATPRPQTPTHLHTYPWFEAPRTNGLRQNAPNSRRHIHACVSGLATPELDPATSTPNTNNNGMRSSRVQVGTSYNACNRKRNMSALVYKLHRGLVDDRVKGDQRYGVSTTMLKVQLAMDELVFTCTRSIPDLYHQQSHGIRYYKNGSNHQLIVQVTYVPVTSFGNADPDKSLLHNKYLFLGPL